MTNGTNKSTARTSCVSRHPVSYIVSACFVYRVSREHSTAAVGFHFGVHRTILSLRARRPHSEMRGVLFLVCIKNSTISSKHDHCCILVQVACFFFGGVGILPFFFSLLYVRTSCVSRHPVSYIVSAYLVSYCLLVRQQQRFHHPTLGTTSVTWDVPKKATSPASVYTAV